MSSNIQLYGQPFQDVKVSAPSAGKRSRLEIRVAIKTKSTKTTEEWERPVLDDVVQASLRSAIEALGSNGQAVSSDLPEFEEADSELQITNKGIYKKYGSNGSNLLDKDTITPATRKDILTKLSAIANAVIHKGGNPDDVKIEVRVVPEEEVVPMKGQVEALGVSFSTLHTNLTKIHNGLTDKRALMEAQLETGSTLRDRRYQLKNEDIDRMQQHFYALHDASHALLIEMRELQTRLLGRAPSDESEEEESIDSSDADLILMDEDDDAGILPSQSKDIQAAIKRYSDKMPGCYRNYVRAMWTWQNEQRILDQVFRVNQRQNPLQVDTNALHLQTAFAEEIYLHALYSHAREPSAALEALREMQKTESDFHTNIKKHSELSQYAEEKIDKLIVKEDDYYKVIAAAIKDFEVPQGKETKTPHQMMLDEGWTENECTEYLNNLKKLLSSSDKAGGILKETRKLIVIKGDIQGALQYFSKQMAMLYPNYVQTCSALAFRQQFAKGRLFDLPKAFNLDLNYAQVHKDFLQEISDEITEVALVNKNGQPAFDSTLWNNGLTAMQQRGQILSRDCTFAAATTHLNSVHKRSSELTERIGTFVKEYKQHRDLFERIMRKHDISDTESAFIFNNYERIYNELLVWNREFQKVTDEANKQNYLKAIELYAEMIKEQFPKLVDIQTNANHAAFSFSDQRVQNALEEFVNYRNARNGKMGSPRQITADLSVWRLVTNQSMEFDDLVKMAAKNNLIRKDYTNIVEKAAATSDGGIVAMDYQLFLITEATEKGNPVSEVEELLLNKITEMLISKRAKMGKMNQMASSFERLAAQNDRLVQFFNYKNLVKNQKPTAVAGWHNIVRRHGWSVQDREAFNVLNKRYGALIKPLQETEQAIQTETNPQKKRALKIQLKTQVKKIMPEVLQLRRDLQRSGGFKKLETLNTAAGEFAQITEDKKFAKEILDEASDLVLLVQERSRYLDDKLVTLGLESRSVETINSLIKQAAAVNVQAFEALARNAGLTASDIAALSSWYAEFMDAAGPLLKVKRELDADTENPALQKAFRKVADQNLPKLNQLNKDSRAKKLESLKKALLDFGSTHCEPELERIAETLENPSTKADETVIQRAKLRKYQAANAALSSLEKDLSGIEDTKTIIEYIELEKTLPMSWDKDFLNALTDKRSLLFAHYHQTVKDARHWDELIWKSHFLKEKDIETIQSLYRDYQKALSKIVELGRQLEANSKRASVRRELFAEMRQRQTELKAIQTKVDQHRNTKIKYIQDSLNDLNKELEKEPQDDIKVQKTLLLIERLNPVEAFAALDAEYKQIYDRFGQYLPKESK